MHHDSAWESWKNKKALAIPLAALQDPEQLEVGAFVKVCITQLMPVNLSVVMTISIDSSLQSLHHKGHKELKVGGARTLLWLPVNATDVMPQGPKASGSIVSHHHY